MTPVPKIREKPQHSCLKYWAKKRAFDSTTHDNYRAIIFFYQMFMEYSRVEYWSVDQNLSEKSCFDSATARILTAACNFILKMFICDPPSPAGNLGCHWLNSSRPALGSFSRIRSWRFQEILRFKKYSQPGIVYPVINRIPGWGWGWLINVFNSVPSSLKLRRTLQLRRYTANEGPVRMGRY
jgi:hypothetical protein